MTLAALRVSPSGTDRFPAPVGWENGQRVGELAALITWRAGRLAALEIDRREPA